jgi:hypothetical protein
MNIDERLEALVQTVELLGHMQQETEKQVKEGARQILITQAQVMTTQEQVQETSKQIHDVAALFGFVAGDHQNRLRKLEGESSK